MGRCCEWAGGWTLSRGGRGMMGCLHSVVFQTDDDATVKVVGISVRMVTIDRIARNPRFDLPLSQSAAMVSGSFLRELPVALRRLQRHRRVKPGAPEEDHRRETDRRLWREKWHLLRPTCLRDSLKVISAMCDGNCGAHNLLRRDRRKRRFTPPRRAMQLSRQTEISLSPVPIIPRGFSDLHPGIFPAQHRTNSDRHR